MAGMPTFPTHALDVQAGVLHQAPAADGDLTLRDDAGITLHLKQDTQGHTLLLIVPVAHDGQVLYINAEIDLSEHDRQAIIKQLGKDQT